MNYADTDATKASLLAAGLSDVEAGAKARAFAQAAELLGPAKNPSAFFIPGRVEVVGKHTDYGGGRSLLCAVERGFTLLASPRTDALIRLRSLDGSVAEFPLAPTLTPDMTTWAGYPQTVARRVAQNFSTAHTGADIVFHSDLPRASGMSSSSAMVVAIFLALSAVNHLPDTPEYHANILTPEDLAGYLGTNENGQTFRTLPGDRGVGTFGGSEDHTAILLSRPNQLVQYAYCPVRHERTVDFPADLTFVIASSGVVAEKTGAAMASYNRVSLLLRAVLSEWNRATGRADATLAAAIEQGGQGGAAEIRRILTTTRHADYSSTDLLDRFDQFNAENNEIINPFADALARRDWPALGTLADRSQHLSETQLKNQVPQTIFLAKAARELGALAANAFGAGFGGSVWALVPTARSATFAAEWKSRYAARHPDDAARSTFFPTRPGPAAFKL